MFGLSDLTEDCRAREYFCQYLSIGHGPAATAAIELSRLRRNSYVIAGQDSRLIGAPLSSKVMPMKGCRAIRSLGLVSLGVACAVGTRSTETNGGAGAVPARFGPAVAAVRRFILDTMRVLGAPGAAICVSQDGRLIWSEGFGFADLEQRVPVTIETRFRIGSVSKPLTAAALGLL